MAGPIRIAILANGRQAKAEMRGVAAQAGLMGGALKRTAGLVGGVFAVGAVVRAGKAFTQVGGEYVSSLNKIQALTGATRTQMERAATQLESTSGAYAKMGQTTGDAAAGVVELTKAGVSLNDSLRAVRATMTLAKAGELEVADASTLVANTLNTFSLKAKRAADIANYLANAANISSADVVDIAESFKYVSPIAAKAGVSLAQTNAVLAELANSGVKASQAGTGFRKFLLSLQAPTTIASKSIKALGLDIYDAQGNMRPLASVIRQLRGSLDDLSQEDQNKALKNIFGLTGITSAQILLKGGVKGLNEYTKGVQRAGAAQKLANSASRGLKGTLDSLRASVVSSAQAWYREYSPAVNGALQDGIKWLREHQAQIVGTAKSILSDLVPAAKDLAKAIYDGSKPIRDLFVPALKTASTLVRGAARIFDAIPDPIKALGVQAGIAALALPRLTAAVTSVTGSITLNIARLQQFRAEMTYTETRAQRLTAITAKLGAAAKAAAGVGGLLLLADGAQQASQGLGILEKTAGAALTGFAVGGPIGAALAAGVTGTWSLVSAIRGLKHTYGPARTEVLNFRDALEQSNGAITEQIRKQILLGAQSSGVAGLTARLGVSQRDLIGAVQGNAGATRRLNAAYQRNFQLLDGSEQVTFNRWLRQNTHALALQGAEVRQNERDLQPWKKALRGLPSAVRTEVKQIGADISARQLRALKRQYDLTPKQVNTIISAIGSETTIKKIDGVYRALDAAGNVRADLGAWEKSFLGYMDDGKTDATLGGIAMAKNLRSGTGRARPDFGPFFRGLNAGIDSARGTASSGGASVGNALSWGMESGIRAAAWRVTTAARSVANQAIAAAKHAADAHSPSRKMQRLGHDLGDGLALGMRDRERHVAEAARRLSSIAVTGHPSRPNASEVYRLSQAASQPTRVRETAVPDFDRRVYAALNRLVDGRAHGVAWQAINDNEDLWRRVSGR